MKKTITIAMCVIATASFGDISVDWYAGGFMGVSSNSTDGIVYDGDNPLLSQLIWNPTAPSGTAAAGGALVSGERLLDFNTALFGNFSASTPKPVYVNDDDGVIYEDGYLFSRVWNTDKTKYWQSAAIDTLPAYSTLDAGTIIDAEFVDDLTKYTNITAIPEPASMALVALGSAVAWLFRFAKRQY